MEETKMAKNERALNEFMQTIGWITEELDDLQEHFKDHAGIAPDSVNWGHVGTMKYCYRVLHELGDFVFCRGEYAEVSE
jgi:hypothetical protein